MAQHGREALHLLAGGHLVDAGAVCRQPPPPGALPAPPAPSASGCGSPSSTSSSSASTSCLSTSSTAAAAAAPCSHHPPSFLASLHHGGEETTPRALPSFRENLPLLLPADPSSFFFFCWLNVFLSLLTSSQALAQTPLSLVLTLVFLLYLSLSLSRCTESGDDDERERGLLCVRKASLCGGVIGLWGAGGGERGWSHDSSETRRVERQREREGGCILREGRVM